MEINRSRRCGSSVRPHHVIARDQPDGTRRGSRRRLLGRITSAVVSLASVAFVLIPAFTCTGIHKVHSRGFYPVTDPFVRTVAYFCRPDIVPIAVVFSVTSSTRIPL